MAAAAVAVAAAVAAVAAAAVAVTAASAALRLAALDSGPGPASSPRPRPGPAERCPPQAAGLWSWGALGRWAGIAGWQFLLQGRCSFGERCWNSFWFNVLVAVTSQTQITVQQLVAQGKNWLLRLKGLNALLSEFRNMITQPLPPSGLGGQLTSPSRTLSGETTSASGHNTTSVSLAVTNNTRSEKLFTPKSELAPEELKQFEAKKFTLGKIPLNPPPLELLNI